MRKLQFILVCFVAIAVTACKVTEPDNLTFTKDDEIYNNLGKIRQVLTNVYAGLPNGYSNIGNSWIAAASDEAEEVDNLQSIQRLNTANITPFSNPDGIWNNSYESIRDAQIFLNSTDTIKWEGYRLSDPAEYARRNDLIKQYRAESKFLLAYFYFELIKRYGGVPLVNEVIDISDKDWVSRFPRSSFSDCVDFIVATCDDAIASGGLLTVPGTGDYGRATVGAAMALKARTLLYAASDLYNVGVTNPLLGYTNGTQQERWIKAAKANKDVLDLGTYSFQTASGDYSSTFVLGSKKSNEVIFERRYDSSNSFEIENSPIGLPLGKTGTCPSENLVSAYQLKTGADFDWSNPILAANPYANRDPRLLETVVVNNSTYGTGSSNPATTVEIWKGGISGLPLERASKTGYYLRKYLDETLNLSSLPRPESNHQWIFIRLAEIYLNYAEAMNEAYGADVTGPDNLNKTARAALNDVRTRSKIAMPAIAIGLSTSDMLDAIRRERRVELAFEGHRFYDLRRWKIASETLGAPLKGVDIVKEANDSFTYTVKTVEQRIWKDAMYYYPIPQAEVIKSNNVIVQNPNW